MHLEVSIEYIVFIFDNEHRKLPVNAMKYEVFSEQEQVCQQDAESSILIFVSQRITIFFTQNSSSSY